MTDFHQPVRAGGRQRFNGLLTLLLKKQNFIPVNRPTAVKRELLAIRAHGFIEAGVGLRPCQRIDQMPLGVTEADKAVHQGGA